MENDKEIVDERNTTKKQKTANLQIKSQQEVISNQRPSTDQQTKSDQQDAKQIRRSILRRSVVEGEGQLHTHSITSSSRISTKLSHTMFRSSGFLKSNSVTNKFGPSGVSSSGNLPEIKPSTHLSSTLISDISNPRSVHSSEFYESKVEVPLRRGYYSELLTKVGEIQDDDIPGAFKRTKLIWQVRTERHCPVMSFIEPPKKPYFLAPAERWTCYKEEKQIVFSLS